MNKRGQAEGIFWFLSIIFIIFLFIWIIPGIRIVGYNEYGMERTFTGKLVPEMREQGYHHVGWGTMMKINNQVRNYEVVIDSASSDFQDVQVTLNLNIQIQKDKVYDFVKNYRNEEEYNKYLNNKVEEKVKTVLLKYNAEEILRNRLAIRDEMIEEVGNLEELKYFKFNDLTIKNIEYSEKFNEVLEAKARVLQEREIITRQKENLELVKKNMDSIDVDKYFKYQLIEKWDGKSALFVGSALIANS